LPLIFLIIH